MWTCWSIEGKRSVFVRTSLSFLGHYISFSSTVTCFTFSTLIRLRHSLHLCHALADHARLARMSRCPRARLWTCAYQLTLIDIGQHSLPSLLHSCPHFGRSRSLSSQYYMW